VDGPIGDPPGNTPTNDDGSVTPIVAPPTGDLTPPVLGEVLPESEGPVAPPPLALPNAGNGGLAATDAGAALTTTTLMLIAVSIALASASALHFVQRRLSAPKAN
jgi:hypothetical protein